MTIYTFDQAVAAGPHWYEQAAQGTDPAAFERAVEVVGQFVDYDWAAEYDDYPDRVFYDYFMGHLMNAYTRTRAQVTP